MWLLLCQDKYIHTDIYTFEEHHQFENAIKIFKFYCKLRDVSFRRFWLLLFFFSLDILSTCTYMCMCLCVYSQFACATMTKLCLKISIHFHSFQIHRTRRHVAEALKCCHQSYVKIVRPIRRRHRNSPISFQRGKVFFYFSLNLRNYFRIFINRKKISLSV